MIQTKRNAFRMQELNANCQTMLRFAPRIQNVSPCMKCWKTEQDFKWHRNVYVSRDILIRGVEFV